MTLQRGGSHQGDGRSNHRRVCVHRDHGGHVGNAIPERRKAAFSSVWIGCRADRLAHLRPRTAPLRSTVAPGCCGHHRGGGRRQPQRCAPETVGTQRPEQATWALMRGSTLSFASDRRPFAAIAPLCDPAKIGVAWLSEGAVRQAPTSSSLAHQRLRQTRRTAISRPEGGGGRGSSGIPVNAAQTM